MLTIPSKLNVPEYPENPAKQRAYTLYVVEGLSAMVVAKELRVPLARLYEWREANGWDDARAEMLKIARRAAAEETGLYAAAIARPLVAKYGAIQERMLAAVETVLDQLDDEEPSVITLHRLSQTLASCHSVGKYLLALGGVSDPEIDQAKDNAPRLAVQVNVLNALYDRVGVKAPSSNDP